jgi:DNA-binding transcriptional LysR family regulator
LIAGGRLLGMWPSSVLRFGAAHLSVRVLRVKMPAVRRPVGIVTLKGKTINPVAQLFIDCARQVAKPLVRHK